MIPLKLFPVLFFMLTLISCTSGTTTPNVKESHPATHADDDELRLVEIESGTWIHSTRHNTESFGRVLSNGLVVTSGNEALLIDSGWSKDSEATTQKLLNEIHQASGAHVVRTVFSHYHDDSVGGINALRSGDILTYATSVTADFMEVDGWGRPDSLLSMDDNENTWTLPFGDHHIEIFYPGPGHTVDNIVIYVPHTRVLYGGCLIRPGEF